MRVLHVIPYASSIYGGPTTVVAQIATALTNLGVVIDVATTTAHGGHELDAPIGQPVISNGARYFYFPRQGPKFWMFSWPLRCWLYQNINAYDLIHVHGLFAYTTLPACAAARHFHKPYVITTHGVLDPWCLAHKWWKKFPYYHLLERRNLSQAAVLHATSSFEAAGLAKLEFGDKTRVLPLGVAMPACPDRRNHGAPLSLLFLSRLDPIKGLPVLLRAMGLLRIRFGTGVTLKIAGQGTQGYEQELRALADSLNISGNITFTGFLQGDEKLRALAEADIFVLPSYHENFSLAAAEALASGLPVIVSDQVGIAQEIQAAAAGAVVPVDSPAALADAIADFIDAEVRHDAGLNARRLAEEKFSEKMFGQALLDMYKDILARKSESVRSKGFT